jgi:hypothetical protein
MLHDVDRAVRWVAENIEQCAAAAAAAAAAGRRASPCLRDSAPIYSSGCIGV